MHGRGAYVVEVGMHGGGHVWQGGMHGRYYEIRSMSGRYASYWNAFLLSTFFRAGIVYLYNLEQLKVCLILRKIPCVIRSIGQNKTFDISAKVGFESKIFWPDFQLL